MTSALLRFVRRNPPVEGSRASIVPSCWPGQAGKEWVLEILFGAACFGLLFYFFDVLIFGASLLARIQLGMANALLANMLALLALSWLMKYPYRKLAAVNAAGAAFLLVAVVLATQMEDYSYDGQMYHKISVEMLGRQGWNPIHRFATDTNVIPYINFYPKIPWYFGATLCSFTDNIEIGKASIWFLGEIAGIFCFHYFYRVRGWRGGNALLLSFCLVANPIFCTQIFTSMVDAGIGLCFVIFFINFLAYSQRMEIAPLVSILIALTVIGGSKFTGLVFAVVLGVTFSAMLLLRRRQVPLTHGLCLALAALAFVIVNFQPYVTNTAKHGHPFYPIFTPESPFKSTFLGNQTSSAIISRPLLEKLFLTTFSISEDIGPDTPDRLPILKVPFALYAHEFNSFAVCGGLRIGAGGPWFGGIVCLIGILAICCRATYDRTTLFLCALFFITVVIIPDCWNLRIVPQFVLLPILVVAGITFRNNQVESIAKPLILVLFLINSLMIIVPGFVSQLGRTYVEKRKLAVLTRRGIDPVKIDFAPYWTSEGERLRRYGLRYDSVTLADSISTITLGSGARVDISGFPAADQDRLRELEQLKVRAAGILALKEIL